MMLAGANAGLDVLSSLFGYFASQSAAAEAESRGRLLRVEAEDEATRYAEEADHFKAKQKLAYLKSGVQLSGSPLDVLDETSRIAQENINSIRARGAASQYEANAAASGARMQGRMALLTGILRGGKTVMQAGYERDKSNRIATENRKNRTSAAPLSWTDYSQRSTDSVRGYA